jgi:hypothetical protein
VKPLTAQEKDEVEYRCYLAKWANGPEFEDMILSLDTSNNELQTSLYGEAVCD